MTTRPVPLATLIVLPPARAPLPAAVGLCLLLVVPTILLLMADPRVLDGESVWLKPLKFQLALALHGATLLLILAHLPAPLKGSTFVRWSAGLVGVTAVYEATFLMIQSGRGVRSHFNDDTAFDAIGGSIMAAGAGILTLVPALVGVALMWRIARGGSPGPVLPLHLGMALGLVASGLLGMQTGGALGANGGPYVGAAEGPFLPLMGWSMSGGDLRIAHFLAIHALQGLPLLALAVTFAPWPRRRAAAAVLAFAGLWTVVVIRALARAQDGLPPL